MDGATYRWLREGEEPALLELLQATFARWPGVDVRCEPIEHLRWKLMVLRRAALLFAEAR
jgi:hypothetical protein